MPQMIDQMIDFGIWAFLYALKILQPNQATVIHYDNEASNIES